MSKLKSKSKDFHQAKVPKKSKIISKSQISLRLYIHYLVKYKFSKIVRTKAQQRRIKRA